MMIRNLLLAPALLMIAPQVFATEDVPENQSVLQSVTVGYDLNTLRPSGGADYSLNGFTAGYTVDFNVASSMPLYVGTGIDWHFLFRSKTYNDSQTYDAITASVKTTFINLTVPVNVSYMVPLTRRFSLTPQLGLDFRVQVYGNQKTKVNVPGAKIASPADAAGFTAGSVNLLSRSQLGNDALRRFQLGWHAGLKLKYDSFVVGISYGTDFVKLRNELGSSNLMVNLGYMF